MHKGTQVAEIVTARARFKAADIRVGFFVQLVSRATIWR